MLFSLFPQNVGEDSEADLEEPGPSTSYNYKTRSRSSKWRDEEEILAAAHNDPDAVLATGQTVFKNMGVEGGKEASKVLKRMSDEPAVAVHLLKVRKFHKEIVVSSISQQTIKYSIISVLAFSLFGLVFCLKKKS